MLAQDLSGVGKGAEMSIKFVPNQGTCKMKTDMDFINWNWVRKAVLLLAIVASLAASFLRKDSGSNWQLMKTAVVTTISGGDPYLPSDEQKRHPETNLSWPYAALWLIPVAAMTVLGPHQIVLFILFLAGIWMLPEKYKEKEFCGVLCLSLMTTLHSGNIAVVEFVLMCLVFRAAEDGEFRVSGSLIGILATLKLLPMMFLAALPYRRAMWHGVIFFVLILGVGFAVFPDYAVNYINCIMGDQGFASVASEVRLRTMDNQTLWNAPVPFFNLGLIFLAVIGWLMFSNYKQHPVERMAVVISVLFLIFPRIPPHAFLAYAAVPMLVLYQRLSPFWKWVVVWINLSGAWLLVLRSLNVFMETDIQYWTCFFTFMLMAIPAMKKEPIQSLS